MSTAQPLSAALDKFVALDPDKCALVYLLLRSSGARFVVEAGTSFGLSTVYLALAVGQNASSSNATGKVIATEKEAHKAVRAREHWKKAGEEVEPWIELREGDLRETLKTDLPEQVDFVLLDSELTVMTERLVHGANIAQSGLLLPCRPCHLCIHVSRSGRWLWLIIGMLLPRDTRN